MHQHPTPPPAPGVPGPFGVPGSNRALGACCLGCAGLVVFAMAGALLVLIGSNTGPLALLAGMLLATIPVPVYASLALWLDRYEPEPPALLAGAFVWGAVVAVFFAYVLNTANSIAAYSATGSQGFAEVVGAVISAPVVEETAKGLALLILFLWKREEFEGVVDGVVYASMVALGFAMTENFQYYGQALAQGGAFSLTMTFVLRGVMSPFSHPLFTAFTGIGLGLARQVDHPAARFLAPPAGLACAMGLHALWNGSASIHVGAWLGAYVLVMAPAGLVVLGVVALSLKYEGNLLRTYLEPELRAGILSFQDYSFLVSIRGRLATATSVLFREGPVAWVACERFNNLAAELAFLRHRVQRGITPPERAAALEADIMQRMRFERARFSVPAR